MGRVGGKRADRLLDGGACCSESRVLVYLRCKRKKRTLLCACLSTLLPARAVGGSYRIAVRGFASREATRPPIDGIDNKVY